MNFHFDQHLHRRALHHNRQENALQKRQRGVLATTTTPAPVKPAPTPDRPTTTTTPVKPPLIPIRPTASSTLPSSVPSVTPSASSDSSVPSSAASSTASTPTPIIPPPVIPSPVLPSSSSTPTSDLSSSTLDRSLPSSSSSDSVPLPSNTADASNGGNNNDSGSSNTGTIVGAIAGSIGGIIVLSLIVAFIVRRLRKRRINRFDRDSFRKSAVMLDEKNEKKLPRPPSMIERRGGATPVPGSTATTSPTTTINTSNLPPPRPAFPYSDAGSASPQASNASIRSFQPYAAGSAGHYPPAHAGYPAAPAPASGPGAMYGLPPPNAYGHGAQYEGAGYGAPPIPGTYGPGAYAPYGHGPHAGYGHGAQYQGYAPNPYGYGPGSGPHGHGYPAYGPGPGGYPPHVHPQHQHHEMMNGSAGGLPNPFPASSSGAPSSVGHTSSSEDRTSAAVSDGSASEGRTTVLSEKQQLSLRLANQDAVALNSTVGSNPSGSSSSGSRSGAGGSRRRDAAEDEGDVGDEAPPPAYVDDGKYRPAVGDHKTTTTVRLGVEGTSMSTTGGSSQVSASGSGLSHGVRGVVNDDGVNRSEGNNSGAVKTGSATVGQRNASGAQARQPRPTSSYTLYDQDDAYGGM